MSRSSTTHLVIDVGSSCVRALIGRGLPDSRTQVLSVFEEMLPPTAAHAPLEQALLVDAIQRAANQAMAQAEERVEDAWLTLPADWCEVVRGSGETYMEKGELRREHLRAAIENAQMPHMGPNRQVVHQWVLSATLDGRTIEEPYHDEKGRHLRVESLMVVCNARALEHRLETIRLAGFRPQGVLLETLAAATATLSVQEMKDGVAVIDLGAQKTSVGVFHGGTLRDVVTLEAGGVSFTEELATSLRIPLVAASRLQEVSSCICVPALVHQAPIDIPLEDGETRRVTPQAIAQILEPRVAELLADVATLLQQRGYRDLIQTVVLTGGAAWMRGLSELAEHQFSPLQWEPRLGLPARVSVGAELVSQTRYATLVGTLQEASMPSSRRTFYVPSENGVGKQILKVLSRFFDSFF